jgi:hypothetical protein
MQKGIALKSLPNMYLIDTVAEWQQSGSAIAMFDRPDQRIEWNEKDI